MQIFTSTPPGKNIHSSQVQTNRTFFEINMLANKANFSNLRFTSYHVFFLLQRYETENE